MVSRHEPGEQSDSELSFEPKANDIAVGEEAAVLLPSSGSGSRVMLTGSRLTLVDSPAHVTIEQLNSGEWMLTLPGPEREESEVAFAPQGQGEYDVKWVAGLSLARDSMRVVGD